MARAKRQTKQQKIDADKITEKNIKAKIEACLAKGSKDAIAALYEKVRARKKQKPLINKLRKQHYEFIFPQAKPGDLDRVNLREIWIDAYVKLGRMPSYRVINSLQDKGYLESALSYIQLSKIGTKGFQDLKKKGIIFLTDEFIAFNFYTDKLTPKQIAKIFDKIYNTKTNEKEILSKFEIYKRYPPSFI